MKIVLFLVDVTGTRGRNVDLIVRVMVGCFGLSISFLKDQLKVHLCFTSLSFARIMASSQASVKIQDKDEHLGPTVDRNRSLGKGKLGKEIVNKGF